MVSEQVKRLTVTLSVFLLLRVSAAAGAPPQVFQHGSKDEPVFALSFTPDGKRLVSLGPRSGPVMWDLASGRRLWEVSEMGGSEDDHFDAEYMRMALSPDGKTVALVRHRYHVVGERVDKGEAQVVLMNAEDGGRQRVLYRSKERPGPAQPIGPLCFSPDGDLLAFGDASSNVHLLDLKTEDVARTLELPRVAQSISFSPDGKHLAAGLVPYMSLGNRVQGGPDGLVVFRMPDGERVGGTAFGSAPFSNVMFSPDGKLLAASVGLIKGGIATWDVGTWGRAPALKNADVPANKIVFSPDGRLLAANFNTSWRGVVRVWQVGKDARPQSHYVRAETESLDFSPDGRVLAVGAWDGKVRLINLN